MLATEVDSIPTRRVRALKAISFGYQASEELYSLFDVFRLMCNDAIRIAGNGKPRNRFSLIHLAYPRLKEYGLHTHYTLSAYEVALQEDAGNPLSRWGKVVLAANDRQSARTI
jgi:hypothetical protein